MREKTAAIIGATGMIGTYLTELLLQDDYFSTVRLIVRRPVPKTDPRMEVKLVNFDDTESLKLALESVEAVFCCVGTTQKNVKGDKDLYRKIDFDIPVKAAMLCSETGCNKFIIVSAVGASLTAGSFYLRLKGQVEDALQISGVPCVHIMQPCMLMGDRKEHRSLEKLLTAPMQLLSYLFVGAFRKYKSIHGKTVAKAMVNAAKLDKFGVFKYTYDGMVSLSVRG